jgi:glutaredoxin 3
MKQNCVLYKFDSCPFCLRVMSYLKSQDITIPMRDTMRDPSASKELLAIGGKTQVPCLIIDGKALYESNDIITWFEENWS